MRPKIAINLTPFDKLLETSGYLVVLGIWALVWIQYNHLPELIPTHFNARGQVDLFGNKSELFGIPIVASLIFIALTVLNRFPHIFNYPVAITPDNAAQQYRLATRIIRYLKTLIPILFALMVVKTVNDANGSSDAWGIWLLPLVLILVLVPLAVYLFASIQSTSQNQ